MTFFPGNCYILALFLLFSYKIMSHFPTNVEAKVVLLGDAQSLLCDSTGPSPSPSESVFRKPGV